MACATVVFLMGNQTLSNKEQIANLAAAVRIFEPVLVNEKWNGEFKKRKGFSGKEPTRDELLNMAAGAIMGMREYIDDYEKVLAKYNELFPVHAELKADAMIAHQSSIQKGVSAPSLAEAMDTWIGRFMQAIDVFKKIYETDIQNADGDFHAAEFQSIARAFAARFINPDHLKPIGGLSGTLTALPSPDVNSAGDDKANGDSRI